MQKLNCIITAIFLLAFAACSADSGTSSSSELTCFDEGGDVICESSEEVPEEDKKQSSCDDTGCVTQCAETDYGTRCVTHCEGGLKCVEECSSGEGDNIAECQKACECPQQESTVCDKYPESQDCFCQESPEHTECQQKEEPPKEEPPAEEPV